jgi:sulfoxide reductase catalytic subunit YedY
MLIKKPADIRSSEVTPKRTYLGRREFLQAAGFTAAAAATGALNVDLDAQARQKLNIVKRTLTTTDAISPYEDITTYNN